MDHEGSGMGRCAPAQSTTTTRDLRRALIHVNVPSRLPAFLKRLARRLRWPALALVLLLAWARWWPMDPLFDAPRSTVLLNRDGHLLGATVAKDGQWRMPPCDSVPHRFERCLL